MFVRGVAVVSAATACLLIASPHAEAAKRQSYRAHWSLNEVNSPTASDSSGNGNDGANHNVVGDGSGYIFNGVDSRVIVPTASSLNPGFADFSWGVTLRMKEPPSPVGETYDVLRKGLVTTKGGDYKLEVKNVKGKALARCVSRSFRSNGTKVLAAIQSRIRFDLADNHQHAVTCTKTSSSISVAVDSSSPRTKNFSAGLGSVSNTANLALGAKAESTATTGFDWFDGELFDAWVT